MYKPIRCEEPQSSSTLTDCFENTDSAMSEHLTSSIKHWGLQEPSGETQLLNRDQKNVENILQMMDKEGMNIYNIEVHKEQAIQEHKQVVFVDEFRHTDDFLNEHFNEMMRRYHDLLAEKDQQIRELQEALACCKNQKTLKVQPDNLPIQQERLRRTEAAVSVFKNNLDLVKKQLHHSPVSEENYLPSSSRERAVLQQLRRRNRFWVLAEIEKLGKDFLRKLELEEKLDALNWQVETQRFQASQKIQSADVQDKCSKEEFEMLESTRNNLLKALKDLRTNTKEEEHQHAQVKDGVSINTIQNLYSSSRYRTTSGHEWPDK